MKRVCVLILFILCILPACHGDHNQAEGILLYFASQEDHGPAIAGQPLPDGPAPTPEKLVASLLAGPTQDSLRSPFPKGLHLRGCTLNGGRLTVNFSEQYGDLSDISLTLADYCLVLTLCQLEGVEEVEITVLGHPVPQRSHQILTQAEALLLLEGGQSS